MGASWLRLRGFDETCARMVEGHVLAKRWLVAKDPSYVDGLSDASKVTLVYQGGAMTEEEAKLFEADPLFDQIIALRKWDDGAKLLDEKDMIDVPSSIDHFLPAVERAITRSGVEPHAQVRHFILDDRRFLSAITSSEED